MVCGQGVIDALGSRGRLLGADQTVNFVNMGTLDEGVEDVAADGTSCAGQELWQLFRRSVERMEDEPKVPQGGYK